jgi:hypothetical protein
VLSFNCKPLTNLLRAFNTLIISTVKSDIWVKLDYVGSIVDDLKGVVVTLSRNYENNTEGSTRTKFRKR